VSGVEDVAGLAAGYGHTCAAHSDGSVSCWGLNHFGQLGDGTLQDRDEPVEVCGLEGVATVSTGDFNTCAVSDGRVQCWGRVDPFFGGPVVSEDPSSETIGLRCGAPVACDEASYCHSGFYLERSVCTRDCSDQNDYPAGTACVANIRDLDSERTEGSYCLLPCSSDTDCPDSDCSGEHAEGRYCF
jgi:hypothetical protein